MQGKFTCFMAGEKFVDTLPLGQKLKEKLDPEEVDINFANPTDKTFEKMCIYFFDR